MATQNVNIGINVSDNGTAKKVVKNFEEIAKAANNAQKAASKVNTPVGGTQGSRAVYAKSAPTGSQSMMTGEDYGRARGSAGATGASGRDFANQAQGLGGLVRLYATYAANVFAVGAAFRALSSAMDTSNMVKGLDQLGASSGMALGSLSKRLVTATGGAISLREAMEATAKASSSGMNSTNILRMGEAAKKASQALGVDMSDAVSRISRGITKLEPELLDELGIFVRVDDVVKKYADSTGKAASAVTDFEKRQAFANAVLDQAEKKFGALEIDTNPYTKLAATIADLSQNALEFVNKGLTPLVSLLAASPTALSVVLAGIAAILVKQAIPAITDFRAGLVKSAEESKALSQKKLQDLKSSLSSEMSTRIQHLDNIAEAEFSKFEASGKKLLALKESNSKKLKGYDKEALRISQLDPVDIKPENIAYLEQLGKKQTAISAVYRDLASEIKAYKLTEQEYNKAQKDRNIILTEQHPLWTTIGQNEKVYHDEVTAARKRSASSQIAYTASTRGFFAGLRAAGAEFVESKKSIVTTMEVLDASGKATGTTLTTTTKGMNLFSRSIGFVKNAAVGLTASLGTAINAFAPWIQLIGMVVAAGGALKAWLSETTEESVATASALTAITDSTKNLSSTLEAISKKPVLEQFDPKSVSAKATAVGDLAEQLRTGFTAAYKELDKMGRTDKFANWVSGLWNSDVESEVSDRVSKGVASIFQNIDSSSAAGKAASDAIKSILKVDDLSSVKSVNAALDNMSSAERRVALDLISASIRNMGTEMQVSAARGSELVAAFAKADEARKKFATDFMQKDPTTEYGQSLVTSFFKLGEALNDPQQKLNAIKSLADNIKNLPAPTELVLGLQEVSHEVDKLNQVSAAIGGIDAKIAELQLKLAKQLPLISSQDEFTAYNAKKAVEKLNTEIDKLKGQKSIKIGVKLDLQAQVENASDLVSKAQLAVFKTGADLVSSKLSTEWTKAGVTVTNAVASVLSGTETGIKMKAQAEKLMLSVQMEQIKTQRAQILATQANTIALDQAALNKDKENFDSRGDVAKDSLKKLDDRQISIDTRRSQVEEAQAGKAGSQGSYADLTAKIKGGAKDITSDMLNLAQSLEGSGAQLANINAQIKALNIGTKDQLIQLEYKKRGESLQLTLDTLKVEQDRIAASKELNSETNVAATLEKQKLDSRITEFNYQKGQLAFEVEIARQKQVQAQYKPDTENFKNIDTEIGKVKQLQLANEQTYENSKITQGLKNRVELIDKSAKASAQAANDQFVLDTRSLDKRDEALSVSDRLLEAQNASGVLTAKSYILEKDALDQKKAQLTFDRESLSAKNTQSTALGEISRKESELNAVRQTRIDQFYKESDGLSIAAEYTDAELARQKELTAERTRANDTYTTSIDKSTTLRDNLLLILGITKQTSLEQEKYNTLIAQADSLGQSLTAVFGDFGTALGDTVSNMVKLTQVQEQHNKRVLTAEQNLAKFAKDDNSDDKKKALKDLEKAEKARTIAELDGYAATAGSAKKMFKEKTGAYKAFAAVEKALHVVSMAMKVKEMIQDGIGLATKIAKNGVGMASDALAAGVSGVKAVVNAIASMPFPLNIAAGAATAAVVAGLLSSIGGKSPSVGSAGFVPTSEQMQETQGTGMSWDTQGNKVETGGGVFGDSSAKVDAISSSLEILKDNSVVGLNYDNKMLKAFERVANAITGAATALFQIPGIRNGVGDFGTKIGQSTIEKGGLFGSGFGGSVFGGGVTANASVTGSGVKITGTLEELATQIGGTVQGFQNILTQYKEEGGWLGDDDYWTTSAQNLLQLDASVVKAVKDVYKESKDLFVSVAEQAGISADKVTNVFSSMSGSIDIDLRNLTGEETIKELNAVIGTQLSEAAKKVFSSFEEFKKFGESYLETVVRVVDSNMKVSQQIRNITNKSIEDTLNLKGVVVPYKEAVNYNLGLIGNATQEELKKAEAVLGKTPSRLKSLFSGLFGMFGEVDLAKFSNLSQEDIKKLYDAGVTFAGKTVTVLNDGIATSFAEADIKFQSMRITENLIKLAGGIENFVSQTDFFRQNFLTQAEQLAPVQAAVTKEMERLGFAGVDTRDEFKALVQSIDLTNPALHETWQALMNVQEGFDEVAKASEEAAAKVAQEADSLNQQLLQVLGNTTALRQIELDKLDGSNKALQERIWKLQDEAKITQERLGLEQKVLQIFGNTTKLRELELEKVNINNQALQTYIWYLEDAKTTISEYSNKLKEAESNITSAISAITSAEGKIKSVREQATTEYISASQKVADAQQAIADIATQAAQRMYDFGKSLRNFIKETVLANASVSPTANFESTISGALSGNVADIENVQSMAEKAIEAARQSSRTSIEFASKQASILASVGKVADFAESQGMAKPEEDPLVAANKTLEESLLLQSEALAVAKSIDASLTATIRNLFTEYTDAAAELQKAVEDKTAAEAAAAETKRILEAISKNTGLGVDALKISDNNNVDYLKFLTDIQIERLGQSTDQIPDAVASAADSTNETIAKNISEMYNGTLYSIALNTSSALPLLSANLTNQGSMIGLLSSVVSNTSAIAEGVKAGSGAAPAAGSTNIFSKIGNAVSGVVGGVVNAVKKVWKSIFSDVRMKEDISLYKTLDNGINIYDFNYKAPYSFALGSDRKRGVLAQEVEGRYPSAVSTNANGMKQVDYSKLPVPSNILKFAKGGVFSNSVVNTPTTFSLAQMGEAGPEAVMPLRRDTKGNLGVSASINGNSNQELLVEIRALRNEVEKLRYEAQATAKHTNKSAKILERVTRDGESLLITDSATV